MKRKPGVITLMGSGELTATMVEVHKALLDRYGETAEAVFIDTPAGFQLNVDHITDKARDYFHKRVRRPFSVASFKSAQAGDAGALARSYDAIGRADYILVGPGSPTYAVDQWRRSRIPELLVRHIAAGGCLTAASAAALTVGRLTLPVYEIYKVGQAPHWVEGIDILQAFGLHWVVVPHWNNAEGGNHDTRYCFMGAQRLNRLEQLLPEGVGLLGLDEHTALIIDLASETVRIRGMGAITLRVAGCERSFSQAEPLTLAMLRGEAEVAGSPVAACPQSPDAVAAGSSGEDAVWSPIETLAETIQHHLAENRIEPATQAMLALEAHIRNTAEQLAERSAEGAAAEMLRNMIALFGTHLARRPVDRHVCLAPVVDRLLALRDLLRAEKQWRAADGIRDCLTAAGIVVADSPGGAWWRLS